MILIPVLVFVYLVGWVGFSRMTTSTLGEDSDYPVMRGLVWAAGLAWPVILFWNLVKAAAA